MGIYGPLRINQPVDIEIKTSDFEGKQRSRVEGINGDRLSLAAPLKNGGILRLPRGTEVTISFFDQVAVYSFDCLIMSYEIKPIPIIELGSPINSKRVQRRNFVRLDTKIPMYYSRLNESLLPVSEKFDATTIDISGGGMMFSTKHQVELGEMLEIRVCFSADNFVTAIGTAIRVIPINSSKVQTLSVGVEFTIIEEGERDKIIRYIFNQQRELRQRGLL